MAEDRSSKKEEDNIEDHITIRLEEMEQILIRIQQEHETTTELHQWRLQPTDWNARNTTPIEVFPFSLREEDDDHHHQANTATSSSNNTITNYYDWKPDYVVRSHCVIRDKACRLVLYGGNNIVSKRLVDKLKLKTLRKYPPVRVRVRVMGMRDEDKVAEETCKVPVSIGEYYKDKVTCYVVNMDEEEENHQLLGLGGPWLYRVRATPDAGDNSCIIMWNHNRILLQL